MSILVAPNLHPTSLLPVPDASSSDSIRNTTCLARARVSDFCVLLPISFVLDVLKLSPGKVPSF